MAKDRRNQHKLAQFYEDAQRALQDLAKQHGVEVPHGAATIEGQCLHWRLSAYAESATSYWAELWGQKVDMLGLPTHLAPGDEVIDPDGEVWTLLGLDPLSELLPVRLSDSSGVNRFCSISQSQLLQKL